MSESTLLFRKINELSQQVERLRAVEVPSTVLPVANFTGAPFPLAASGSPYYPFAFTILRDGWAARGVFCYYVPTTNDGSNYWTFNVVYSATLGVIHTLNTAAASPSTWTRSLTIIGSSGVGVQLFAPTDVSLQLQVQSTGSPGALYMSAPVVYMR